ncbi:hypothetical protein EMIT079MI2_300011 [Bacillus sp. IT-79MI2]
MINNKFTDSQRTYKEIDGRQQGRFSKQVSLYVKMLQTNKNIL